MIILRSIYRFLPILITITLLLPSCTSPTIQGHWKCDLSGTYTYTTEQGEQKTDPITNYYTSFKATGFELSFINDTTYVTHFLRSGEDYSPRLHGTYITPYNDDSKQIRFIAPYLDSSAMNIGIIKQLSADRLILDMNLTDENMIWHLNMDRIESE